MKIKKAIQKCVKSISDGIGFDSSSTLAVINNLPEALLVPIVRTQLTETNSRYLGERDSQLFDHFTLPSLSFDKKTFDGLDEDKRTRIWQSLAQLGKSFEKKSKKKKAEKAKAPSMDMSQLLSMAGGMPGGAGGGNPAAMLSGLASSLGGGGMAGNPILSSGLKFFMDNQNKIKGYQRDFIEHLRSTLKKYNIDRETTWDFISDIISGIPFVKDYASMLNKDEVLDSIFGPLHQPKKTREEEQKSEILETLKNDKFDL